MGEGNVVSVEFNLLYRWHSALSEKDAQYTTNMFNEFFAGKDPKDVGAPAKFDGEATYRTFR